MLRSRVAHAPLLFPASYPSLFHSFADSVMGRKTLGNPTFPSPPKKQQQPWTVSGLPWTVFLYVLCTVSLLTFKQLPLMQSSNLKKCSSGESWGSCLLVWSVPVVDWATNLKSTSSGDVLFSAGDENTESNLHCMSTTDLLRERKRLFSIAEMHCCFGWPVAGKMIANKSNALPPALEKYVWYKQKVLLVI